MVDGLRLRFITERFKSSDRTLLFYSPRSDPDVFRPFFSALNRLWQGQIRDVALHREPYIHAYGGVELYAHCDPAGSLFGGRKGVIKVAEAVEPRFEWICGPPTWMHLASLILELVYSSGGHQYLRSSPRDDALVIVSSGEYDDQDFE